MNEILFDIKFISLLEMEIHFMLDVDLSASKKNLFSHLYLSLQLNS